MTRHTDCRRPTHQAGWALPATLTAIVLLNSCVRLLSIDTVAAIRAFSTSQRGDSFMESQRQAIFTRIEPETGCTTIETVVDRQRATYEVCGERVLPFVITPSSYHLPSGRIDYDSIFARAARCKTATRETGLTSSNSPLFRRDCLLSSSISGETIALENIIGTSLHVLGGDDQTSLMATAGALSITGDLVISHDLLILTGGTIRIGAIVSTAGFPVRVSAISSLGEIHIGAIKGDVSLLTAGRSVVQAPGSAPSALYPLPPFRPPTLYGFRVTNDAP
jgi:hypothetical protein